jgi:hypothetical protein
VPQVCSCSSYRFQWLEVQPLNLNTQPSVCSYLCTTTPPSKRSRRSRTRSVTRSGAASGAYKSFVSGWRAFSSVSLCKFIKAFCLSTCHYCIQTLTLTPVIKCRSRSMFKFAVVSTCITLLSVGTPCLGTLPWDSPFDACDLPQVFEP